MAKLTRRQREVLSLKAAGLTYKEIGERLHISPRTAANHTSYARVKTGKNTMQLAVLLVSQTQSPVGNTD